MCGLSIAPGLCHAWALVLQVKVQTVPGYAKGLMDGMPKVIAQEGVGGCAYLCFVGQSGVDSACPWHPPGEPSLWQWHSALCSAPTCVCSRVFSIACAADIAMLSM